MLKSLRDLMVSKNRVLLVEEWSGCMGDGLCVWSYDRKNQKTYTQDTPPMIEPVMKRLSDPKEVSVQELYKTKASVGSFDLRTSYGVSQALRALTMIYELHQDSQFQEFYLRYLAMEKRINHDAHRISTMEYGRGRKLVENFLLGIRE